MENIERLYQEIGGTFVSSVQSVSNRLSGIKAFIFDWDGVFNDGSKTANGGSKFSEVDSMGTNLLRYSSFLRNGNIPVSAIISGERNETAFYFSKRECFHYNFFKAATNKIDALNFICEKENIKPEQICYFFDDVLDLGIAEVCGLRILINQQANPLFVKYCIENNSVDYVSANRGGNFAVRETTELLIALNTNYDKVITGRKKAAPEYQVYLNHRRAIHTKFFSFKENKVSEENVL
jgi:3-deoxy-D-manno-octulosonate 8-phosphate phosphatase (KDO 8-P phosphatase)